MHEIDRRLRERGFADSAREEALERLRRTGLVDDARFAEARAATLAARGEGNALIRHRLVRAGVPRELIEDALAGLDPEHGRALRMVAVRGPGPRTARRLLARGFPDEIVRDVVAHAAGDELG